MDGDVSTLCYVINEIPNADIPKIRLRVRPGDTVQNFYEHVCLQLDVANVQLLHTTNMDANTVDKNLVRLKICNQTTLAEAGITFASNAQNKVVVRSNESPVNHDSSPYDDISATTYLPTPPTPPPPPSLSLRPSAALNNSTLLTSKSTNKTEDILIDMYVDAPSNSTATSSAPDVPFICAPPATSTARNGRATTSSNLNNSNEDMDIDMDATRGALKLYTPPRPNHGYVGLVNQAMTCYLNSLLQALYMTPEFRNAMYKWEFVEQDGKESTKSIPYQLQKLFLNLQTSSKTAVETTDLTKSFGWDSSEAWQQHDVQELCRVMFDALEQKFKRTEQADLINRLYEGKMIDYVKCLDCNTEKSREDAFLDIPLPVKPFGSSVAYESIEEALRAFVEPERLDGNNQYFCEKCDRKCDADKGLKFTRFPYILTLHLKRFDFDYQTFHRIKLNDKVTFPQTLYLNNFVKEDYNSQQRSATTNGSAQPVSNSGSGSSEHGSVESAIKCDDCSTTDSESALDDESSNNNHNNINNNNNTSDTDLMQEDDEGIDVTSTTDTKSTISTASSNESGPYVYELFAIMIHSGSASGGHYYAYIKEFETGEWFCFNDQSVSTATQEDINKSFGGGGSSSTRSYSGAYSFSTNAYMLMFRQCDPQRNVYALKKEEFPEHIQTLLRRLDEKKEEDRRMKEREDVMVRFKVYFYNSKLKQMMDTRLFMALDATLEEVLARAHEKLNISPFAPLDRCRLLAYNHTNKDISRSFEGEELIPLQKSMGNLLLEHRATSPLELLLETRDESYEFEPIRAGSINTRVFDVDLSTGDVDGPTDIRTMHDATILEYRTAVAKKLRMNPECLVLALLKSNSCTQLLDQDLNTCKVEDMFNNCKVFVTLVGNHGAVQTLAPKLLKIVNRFEHMLTLYFLLPNTDREVLEKLSIPSFDHSPASLSHVHGNDVTMSSTPSPISPLGSDSMRWSNTDAVDVVDAAMRSAPVHLPATAALAAAAASASSHTFTLPLKRMTTNGTRTPTGSNGPEQPESNSEDSSLSDGDRTLVEDHGAILAGDLSSTNNSPACSDTQLSSPEYLSRRINDFECDDDDDILTTDHNGRSSAESTRSRKFYFRATLLDDEAAAAASMASNGGNGGGVSEYGPKMLQRTLKVLVDDSMTLGNLKRELEPYVCVPKEYFKIFRQSQSSEAECARLNQQLSEFKDGERLVIELGRALRKGEYKCKVFHLKLTDVVAPDFDQMQVVCEWIVCNGADVGQVKRAIIGHLATVDPKYDIAYDACRLRRKSYRSPMEVYTDDQRFGDDITMTDHFELILQELDESSQPITNPEDKCMFVRRWNPSSYTLSPLQEITVTMKDGSGVCELKEVISKASGIPVERVEYMKPTGGSFMRYNVPMLTLHTNPNWTGKVLHSEDEPLTYSRSGEMYFYRDKDEPLKQLTPEEKREISNKEKSSHGGSSVGSSSYSSSRPERGLKIYLDPSPKKGSSLDMMN